MIHKLFYCIFFSIIIVSSNAQTDNSTQKTNTKDTVISFGKGWVTLPEVVVRNNFNYKKLLLQIQEDTTFYKAFRNLRVIEFSSYNDIKMLNKSGSVKASLFSKTRQNRKNGCRTMDVLEEKVTGDFYNSKHNYNYSTAELYAALFFTKDSVCGEDNIVKGHTISTADKTGISKHKEQLKILFFNPGKKIPGIPFIGDKLDLYDDHARKIYEYRIDVEEYKGKLCYKFSILPKEDLGLFRKDDVVVDGMTTWFNIDNFEVLGRNYALSYNAGVYDFDVSMEVEMTHFKDLLVPAVLRYKGNWNVIFKKRERAIFTATLFNFNN